MKRVVITGLGVVSSVGIGKAEYIEGLNQAPPEPTSITIFDTEHCKCSKALELVNFDCTRYIKKKGLRTLDRNTKIALTSTKLALTDSGLDDFDLTEAGFVMGSMFGSLTSISSFDRETIENGPLSVNPAFFPNTVINSPTSQVNIHYGIAGLSTTISSGQTASIDALGYAFQMLQNGVLEMVLAGGSEELSMESFNALDRIQLLSDEKIIPFYKKNTGIIAGEGSAIFVLEELNHAVNRGANILAEIKGYSNTF